MQKQDIAALKGAGVVLSENATKKEILTAVATTIDAIGPSTFKTLRNVEGHPLPLLRIQPVAGTVLEPVALAAALATGKEPATTVGGVMDVLDLTQPDINTLACYCGNGETMTGAQAAANLRTIAAKC